MQPLISVIIPTYNRVQFLRETLDSVVAQSFKNWECIVVDDGSADATDELMEFYTTRDPRIKYFHRPNEWTKGANPSRNYGFQKSKGKYIQWLDSDDILYPQSLEIKLQEIEENNCDFVVAKLINFSQEGPIEQHYNRSSEEIKFEDFLFRKINWITPDPLIARRVLEENNICYNEAMQSDQEYNYYCKLLLHTTNGLYIDKILTRRRIHPASIQSKIDRNHPTYAKSLFRNRYLTFLDLKNDLEPRLIQAYLDQMMTIYYFAVGKNVFPEPHNFFSIIRKKKGFKPLISYFLSLLFQFSFGKGYKLLQLAKGKESYRNS